MKRRGVLACLAGATAWLAGCDRVPAPAANAKPRWPALAVRDLTGRPATLPSASGAPRLINMWALWCPPCRQELPGLERLAWSADNLKLDVVAVALADDGFAVREYLAQHAAGLQSAVMSPGLPVVRELGLDALPQTFLVAGDGQVLARWVGAREWDSPAVREQLEQLLRPA
jgi:thiol-disulfide isomerase/thioredoxin